MLAYSLRVMKVRLREKQLTYMDVADELGIGERTVIRQLNGGARLSADVLLKVAELCNVNVNSFLYTKEEGDLEKIMPDLKHMKQYMTLEEAADCTTWKPATLRRALMGATDTMTQLRGRKDGSGKWVIAAEDLVAWVEENLH